MVTIGDSIRKIRNARGMTMKEVSEKAGYTLQHIHFMETNKHIPKITTAIDLADVFGVSLDELVGRDFKKEGTEE